MPQNAPFPVVSAKTPAGQPSFGLVDAQTALLMAARHGKYYEGVYAAVCAMAANQAGVTTSVGLAATYTGICLSNPAGSAKNLSIMRVSGALIVAPSTITGFNLITGFAAGGITAHTTPLTPFNAKLGVAITGLVGLVDSACTLVGTPAYSRPVAQCSTATNSTSFDTDIDGSIIIPPGGYLAIGTTIASPASGFMGAIEWEENPL